MARHLQQRGRSPNEETEDMFTTRDYIINENLRLQKENDQLTINSKGWEDRAKKSEQENFDMRGQHQQEIKNLQVDHAQELKATKDRHEEERKKWQGEMDDLKSSKANQQEVNCDEEEIAVEVAQQVKDNFSKDIIFESFRRLSPEKALVVYGEVCILLGHDCLWQTISPKILDEIHERQKAKDKQHEQEIEELKKMLAKPTVEVKGDYVEKKEVNNFNKDSNVFNDKVISPQILPSDEDEEKLLA